jgi:hypothetical protein
MEAATQEILMLQHLRKIVTSLDVLTSIMSYALVSYIITTIVIIIFSYFNF